MPTDALLLGGLLIAAAALGWLGARLTARTRGRRGPALPSDYVEGVRYLLDEQPDKALESLVRAAQLDTEVTEVQFALAGLYRRRGEVDRAIRIHQSLLARPDLSAAARNDALLGLAEDYLRAGLFDRAEGLFRQLGQSGAHRSEAARQLVQIYEQQKDWEQAVSAREQLAALGNTNERSVIAHYYCELAEAARAAGDHGGAARYLVRAVKADPAGVRAVYCRAGLARDSGDEQAASGLYADVVARDRTLLPDVLSRLARCFPEGSGEDGLDEALARLRQSGRNVEPALGFAAMICSLEHLPVAQRAIRSYIEGNPVLHKVLQGFGLEEQELADPLMLCRVAVALRALLEGKAMYRCRDCGYAGTQLYWQCPGCRSWDTTRASTQLDVAYVPAAEGEN